MYRNTTNPEELAGLHLADRLMVQLIKIERLAPRIQGMLYKSKFEDSIALLEDGARKLIEASDNLLHAAKFKELMNVSVLSSVLKATAHLTFLVNFAHWQLHERHWDQRRCLWFQSQQYQQGNDAIILRAIIDDGFTSWSTPNLFKTLHSCTSWSEQSRSISLI